jgi:tetraacyldisaccharide 4'-kinase
LTTLDGKNVSENNLSGKSCLAFAGIAKPEEFFASLCGFGFRCIEEVPLADHQEYTPEILNRLLVSCHNHDLLVTTEKDAVKLSSVNFSKPCYQVGVNLIFEDVSPLNKLLDQVIAQH